LHFCISLFLSFSLPLFLHAQQKQQSGRAVDGEMATCTIKVTHMQKKGGKTVSTASESYNLTPNQMGTFDLVPDIQPMQKIPVEIAYPQGRSGEKVIIEVMDGGSIDDNKKVKVVQLNSGNKISFNFQVASDPGMYRVTLRKGEDVKEIQLWVGPAPSGKK
jgi:hypothetical protein